MGKSAQSNQSKPLPGTSTPRRPHSPDNGLISRISPSQPILEVSGFTHSPLWEDPANFTFNGYLPSPIRASHQNSGNKTPYYGPTPTAHSWSAQSAPPTPYPALSRRQSNESSTSSCNVQHQLNRTMSTHNHSEFECHKCDERKTM